MKLLKKKKKNKKTKNFLKGKNQGKKGIKMGRNLKRTRLKDSF